MKTYSCLEASEILKVSDRAIQKRCKAESVRKKNNKYLITKELIDQWKEKIVYKTNSPNERTSTERSEDGTHKQTFNSFLTNQPFTGSIKLKEENAALKLEIQELKEELSVYDIAENERLEVYTETAYAEFEKRLKEYPIQKQTIQEDKNIKKELEFKIKIKDVKLKGTEDLLQLHKDGEEFWKSQSEYKDKQNEKFLGMHSILVESVSNFSKKAFIEATVKAKNTDWSNKKDNK